MALSKQQRLAIIEFLVPLLNDEGQRQMHMNLLFAGESRRPDINLHGAPREATTRIVLALEIYQIERGKPSLVDLLEQVSYDVGIEHQERIEEWQRALVPQPSVSEDLEDHKQVDIVPKAPTERFSIPALFAWITIPAGKVTLEAKNGSYLKKDTTFDVPAFAIGKYPITNAQYNLFVVMGGYKNKMWWTNKAWENLSNNKVSVGNRQSSLNNIFKTHAEYPVIVTWHEAKAFCRWLRDKIKEPVYLCTEQHWQRAAQGDDGRIYPWGNQWNKNHCNSLSSQLTPVDKYEELGDSPYGVIDMVGNAAEWTLTNWHTGKQGGDEDNARVVRGGSYESQDLNHLRVTARTKADPTTTAGFRILRLLE